MSTPASSISVVIAAYDAGEWIERTVTSVLVALERAGLDDAEAIVVDDGSTDATPQVLAQLAAREPRVSSIRQPNLGRLLARRAGLERARHASTLLLDARIEVFPDAFVELAAARAAHPDNRVWNGHVDIRYGWNLFARFWGVVTFVGWRDYLRQPRFVEFGLEEFDRYPKGTGFLLAPTADLLRAMQEYESLLDDPRFASDDTGVLRDLAAAHRIAITPGFGCWYSYGRSSVRGFFRHTLDRGTMFVDSYLRPGTRFFVPLLVFAVLTVVGIVALVIVPLPTLAVLAAGWLLMLVAVSALRAPLRNVLAFAVVSPLFAVAFGLGLWRGFGQLLRTRARRRVA